MRILCAPNEYKETLSAANASMAMVRGARGHDADPCPIADGGDGTMAALVDARGGSCHEVEVAGPLGNAGLASWALLGDGDIAVVELAEASGLAHLEPALRDPLRATTRGTGELIAHAARLAGTVLVALGGSATVDGGTGLAQALGVVFLDADNEPLPIPMCGARLADVHRVERPDDMPVLRAAFDVTNPLLGPEGAARIYGPQKGADEEAVARLEAGLAHLAAVVGDDGTRPGAGAAGGAAWGLAVFCGASLERGIDLVLETIDFDRRCRAADLVLTGEGMLDGTSRFGKATEGVAEAAARCDRRTVVIAGRCGPGWKTCLRREGGALEEIVSLADRFGIRRAMEDTAACLEDATRELLADWSAT